MPSAIVFAVTEEADVFAMRTGSGVVLVASAGANWRPAMGETLTGYRHQLGACTAVVVSTGQTVELEIKSCSDIPRPSTWLELL